MSNTRNLADLLDSGGDIKSAALDNVDISGKLNTSGGTLTGTLTMESTDAGSTAAPELILYRNSASPADGDYLGQVQFKGENDNGGSEIYAKVTGKITDASNGTEDGLIETAIKGNGSFTIVSRQKSDELQLLNGVNLNVDGNITVGGTVDGVDIQTLNTTAGAALPKAGGTMTGNLTVSRSSGNAVTRLQGASNSQSSKLFISHVSSGSGGLFYSNNEFDIFSYGDIRLNSGTGNTGDTIANERMVIKNSGKVGIGETAPLGYLHVKNGDSGQGSINAAGDSLVLESNGSTGITFLSGSSSNTSLIMGDSESNYQGVIIYDHSVNAFKFATTGTERMRINSSGNVGIGVVPKTHNSSHDALQLGGNGVWTSYGTQGASGEMDLQHNAYFDPDGNDKYISTDEASKYRQGGGKHQWYTAASGSGNVSWLHRMTISNNGNIGIGESTPIRKVVIAGSSGNSSTLLLHMDADTAGGECGIEFKADSTNDDRRVKAAIKYRRDDPGTRGTGNLHFCVNGDNNDVNVSTSHSRMMLNTDGLHFNGDTAAANALDDYEEGTWTVTSSDSASGFYQAAHYVKVGGIVHVRAYFGDIGGGTTFAGLPFAAESSTGLTIHQMYQVNWPSSAKQLTSYVSGSNIYFRWQTDTGVGAALSSTDTAHSSCTFGIAGTYKTTA